MSDKFVLDMNGEKIKAGDYVIAYPHTGVKRNGIKGKIKCIADMNEIQVNMVYVEGMGAWYPHSIEKEKGN